MVQRNVMGDKTSGESALRIHFKHHAVLFQTTGES
jgi:hypothetical protein